jgi:hypothetical protein
MERKQHEDRLSAYFDGEMSSNERSEFESQLRDSSELRRTLEEFQRQRLWLTSLRAPALSDGFTNRIMEQVLAVAIPPVAAPLSASTLSAAPSMPLAPPVAPPPFPVESSFPMEPRRLLASRHSRRTLVAIAITTAAALFVGPFVVNEVRKQFGNKNHEVVVAEKDPAEKNRTENQPGDPNDPSAPHVNDGGKAPEIHVAEGGSERKSPEDTSARNAIAGANPIENAPLANDSGAGQKNEGKLDINDGGKTEAVARANSPGASGNAHLALKAGNPKATMSTRPKAYRVQIGSKSEFDERLKTAGVAIYYPKAISPPTDGSKPPRVDILADPEYILVEGPESELDDLVAKLREQADLVLTETREDLEAEFIIEALANADHAGDALRPEDAKDGGLASFPLPAKALRSLLPANVLPTTSNSSIPAAAGANSKGFPKTTMPPKTTVTERELRFVPRVIFLLDVRMGEPQGPPK